MFAFLDSRESMTPSSALNRRCRLLFHPTSRCTSSPFTTSSRGDGVAMLGETRRRGIIPSPLTLRFIVALSPQTTRNDLHFSPATVAPSSTLLPLFSTALSSDFDTHSVVYGITATRITASSRSGGAGGGQVAPASSTDLRPAASLFSFAKRHG
ncbi:hypothetical protein PIB30_018414 [Stylosanthes scabra]|uniref:Uncharacterized protein n=1 Tax=Stylosanthes scabra TaxID=79078 RepID=A0ABU6T8Q0_9FABA|nr:hypothetical protein [Stylosanthes scabra]